MALPRGGPSAGGRGLSGAHLPKLRALCADAPAASVLVATLGGALGFLDGMDMCEHATANGIPRAEWIFREALAVYIEQRCDFLAPALIPLLRDGALTTGGVVSEAQATLGDSLSMNDSDFLRGLIRGAW